MAKPSTAHYLNSQYHFILSAKGAAMLHQLAGKQGAPALNRVPVRAAKAYVKYMLHTQEHVLPRGKVWWEIARREGTTNALYGGWHDDDHERVNDRLQRGRK